MQVFSPARPVARPSLPIRPLPSVTLLICFQVLELIVSTQLSGPAQQNPTPPRAAQLTARVTDFLVQRSGESTEQTDPIATAERRREEFNAALNSDEFNTKERIVLAAVETVLEQGIHSAPVDAIAARARVSKGSVFYSFSSREGLITHVLSTLVDVLALTIARAREGRAGLEALEASFHAVLTLMVRNYPFVHAIFSEITRPDSTWVTVREALGEGMYRPLVEMLGETSRFLDATSNPPAWVPTSASSEVEAADSRGESPLEGDSAQSLETAGNQKMRITVSAIVGAIFMVGQTLVMERADASMINEATQHLLSIADN